MINILVLAFLVCTHPLFGLPWAASSGDVSLNFDAAMVMNNPTVNVTVNNVHHTMLWKDFRNIQTLANFLVPETKLTQLDIIVTLEVPTKNDSKGQ